MVRDAPLTGAKTKRDLEVEARIKGKYLRLACSIESARRYLFRRVGRHLDGLDCVKTRTITITIVTGKV